MPSPLDYTSPENATDDERHAAGLGPNPYGRWTAIQHPNVVGGWTIWNTRSQSWGGLFASKASAEMAAARRNA